ncbi:MAG TPA: hypothetical protein DIW86_24760 [Pseudomonas sp.]|jgi:hypothetical protein|nr:hypothetical protein [Pseudomonas sp.]
MAPRFKVLNFINAADGSVRYRILDGKEPCNANKHGVYEREADANAACTTLNAQRFQVVPPQEIKLVPGLVVDDADYVPAFVAINYHIIDSKTGGYTNDHFVTEPEAIARAEELERLYP